MNINFGNIGSFAEPSALATTMDAATLEVQKLLNKLGYGPVVENGTPSDDLSEALKQFQTAAKLPTTGTADNVTVNALQTSVSKMLASQGQAGAATPEMPMWQKGLMVAGGLALLAVAFYVVASPGKNNSGLAGWLKSEPLGDPDDESKTKSKCARTPDLEAFEHGRPVAQA